MTFDRGHAGTGEQADDIAHYVAAVRQALADLPDAQRDELLEDLPAHLAEVAAEGTGSLTDRLGPPSAYAEELRSTAVAAPVAGAPSRRARVRAARAWAVNTLARLDARGGPLLGYERVSDFGKLLIPAWWVLRGYLAAMVVVTLLDSQGQLGLLPRLGGSTLAGVVILTGFVLASIWLGRRTPSLSRWPRRVLYPASALLVLLGIAGFAGLDANARWGFLSQTTYVYGEPFEHVEDVYVVDENDRLLTDVRLLDQNGDPIDIGWISCERLDELDYSSPPPLTYPRCPDQLRWWARALLDARPDAESGAGSDAESGAGSDAESGAGDAGSGAGDAESGARPDGGPDQNPDPEGGLGSDAESDSAADRDADSPTSPPEPRSTPELQPTPELTHAPSPEPSSNP